MQKKTINILLITICIVIYRAIFVKAFVKKKIVDETSLVADNFTTIDLNFETSKDSVHLFFPKRSPFGEARRNAPIKQEPKKQSFGKQIIKNPTSSKTIWPDIIYHGFIKNKLSNKPLIAVTVNNKMYKVRTSQIIDNLSVNAVFNDSIRVEYNNELKTFYKKN